MSCFRERNKGEGERESKRETEGQDEREMKRRLLERGARDRRGHGRRRGPEGAMNV